MAFVVSKRLWSCFHILEPACVRKGGSDLYWYNWYTSRDVRPVFGHYVEIKRCQSPQNKKIICFEQYGLSLTLNITVFICNQSYRGEMQNFCGSPNNWQPWELIFLVRSRNGKAVFCFVFCCCCCLLFPALSRFCWLLDQGIQRLFVIEQNWALIPEFHTLLLLTVYLQSPQREPFCTVFVHFTSFYCWMDFCNTVTVSQSSLSQEAPDQRFRQARNQNEVSRFWNTLSTLFTKRKVKLNIIAFFFHV